MENLIQYNTTKNVEKSFTIKDEYYKLISSTLQNSCHNLKRIAGRWSNSCGFFDGEKLGMILPPQHPKSPYLWRPSGQGSYILGLR